MTQQDIDEGIFTSDEAVDGIKNAAEKFGIDPNTVDLNAPQIMHYAKASCKACSGRGLLIFVPSPSGPKKIKLTGINKLMEKFTRRSRKQKNKAGKWVNKPTKSSKRFNTEMPAAPTELCVQWNTRKYEPYNFKSNNNTLIKCKCVRSVQM